MVRVMFRVRGYALWLVTVLVAVMVMVRDYA